jgi:ribokinase
VQHSPACFSPFDVTRLLVVGSVNLDISASAPRLPMAGETVTGATLDRQPGGKGGNQALAAQRLGAAVTLVAAVGADPAADLALALLREAGVDLRYCVRHASAATGVALICLAPNGENQIVVAPGANAVLEVPDGPLPPADAFIAQLEVPGSTIAALLEGFSGFVALNLAPARDVSPALLDRADLLVVNETEAAWYGDALSECRALVATTLGAGGARLSRGGEVLATAVPPPVDVVDTTGAGDAFTAALTLALAAKMPAARALSFACTAGALATTRHGAQAAMPIRSAVEELLQGRL